MMLTDQDIEEFITAYHLPTDKHSGMILRVLTVE